MFTSYSKLSSKTLISFNCLRYSSFLIELYGRIDIPKLFINNVFIDSKDLGVCRNVEELRQLQYVALSRTKNNVYILQ